MQDTAHRSTRGNGLLEPLLAKWRFRKAVSLFPRNEPASILDLGCGQYPVLLSQLSISKRVGIDRTPGTEVCGDIRMVRQDLCTETQLPFDRESFEIVTMLATLEHLHWQNIVPLLREVRRILRPGGRFIFTTPHLTATPVLKMMTWLSMVSAEEINEHYTLFTKRKMQTVLLEAGFLLPHVRVYSFQGGMNLYGHADKQ